MESDVRRFLEAAFSEKPSGLYLLVWTLPDKRSYWVRSIDAAIRLLESLHGTDIYVGVGLSDSDLPDQRS